MSRASPTLQKIPRGFQKTTRIPLICLHFKEFKANLAETRQVMDEFFKKGSIHGHLITANEPAIDLLAFVSKRLVPFADILPPLPPVGGGFRNGAIGRGVCGFLLEMSYCAKTPPQGFAQHVWFGKVSIKGRSVISAPVEPSIHGLDRVWVVKEPGARWLIERSRLRGQFQHLFLAAY